MQNEHNEAKNPHEGHEHSPDVTITIDGKEVQIKKGAYRISELKVRLGVPADYELDLVEDGQFRPLDDNAMLEIEKPAIFVSHVRCGSSS